MIEFSYKVIYSISVKILMIMKKVTEYRKMIKEAKVTIKSSYKSVSDPVQFGIKFLVEISHKKDTEVMEGTLTEKEGTKIMCDLLDFSEWIYNQKYAA